MPILKVNENDGGLIIAKRIVQAAARNSSCRRRRVGAAVFDLSGKLIATGHNTEKEFPNGTPRSCMEGDCPRGMASYDAVSAGSPYSDCIATHAEMIALGNAYGTVDREAWFTEPDIIMVVTHKPCHECEPVLLGLDFQVFYLEEM